MALKSLPGIYQIVNNTTEKRYIGRSINIQERVRNHKTSLRRNTHPNVYLQASFNKYGIHDFTFKVLEYCDESSLHFKEHYWVSIFQTDSKYYGYNLKPTDPSGKSRHSKEAIEKIRLARLGKPRSPEEKMKRALYASPLTAAHKEAMVVGRKESLKQLGITNEQRFRRLIGKKILNTLTGETYESLKDLCETMNLKETTLSHKLCGRRPNNTEYRYI